MDKQYIITRQLATRQGCLWKIMVSSAPRVASLRCTLPEDRLARMSSVLQAGFYLDVAAGTPLYAVLVSLPGFTDEYVDRRIQTIFFNGNAIDDLGEPLAGKTAVIALSAAMPGLAGAILRKGSPHAALRRTPPAERHPANNGPVAVRIKLFNAIIEERGPLLLQHGVAVHAADIASFLKLRPSLIEPPASLLLDGTVRTAADIIEALGKVDTILLTVSRQ